MQLIGAKDGVDRAMVRKYASTQTCNFEDIKMDSEEMWKTINMLAMGNKSYVKVRKAS